eukprot:g14448.t1
MADFSSLRQAEKAVREGGHALRQHRLAVLTASLITLGVAVETLPGAATAIEIASQSFSDSFLVCMAACKMLPSDNRKRQQKKSGFETRDSQQDAPEYHTVPLIRLNAVRLHWMEWPRRVECSDPLASAWLYVCTGWGGLVRVECSDPLASAWRSGFCLEGWGKRALRTYSYCANLCAKTVLFVKPGG